MSNQDLQQRFINSALAAHNNYRKVHGVKELTHNPELSKIALNWSQRLIKTNQLQHSRNTYKNNQLGENLYYANGYGDIDYGIHMYK